MLADHGHRKRPGDTERRVVIAVTGCGPRGVESRNLVSDLRIVGQALKAMQPRAQIDDRIAGDRAEARPPAQSIARKAHIRVPPILGSDVLEVGALTVNGDFRGGGL